MSMRRRANGPLLWSLLAAALLSRASSSIAQDKKPVPATLVGWFAYHLARAPLKCRKVDAGLDRKLRALGCAWEMPMATPAVVCHEQREDAWIAFEQRTTCQSEVALMNAD